MDRLTELLEAFNERRKEIFSRQVVYKRSSSEQYTLQATPLRTQKEVITLDQESGLVYEYTKRRYLVYKNDLPILPRLGDTIVDEDGDWEVSPDSELAEFADVSKLFLVINTRKKE